MWILQCVFPFDFYMVENPREGVCNSTDNMHCDAKIKHSSSNRMTTMIYGQTHWETGYEFEFKIFSLSVAVGSLERIVFQILAPSFLMAPNLLF